MLKKTLIFFVVCMSLFAQKSYASFAVVNSESGAILLEQNAHTPLPVASLTKVWTAYIVIKNSSLHELVTVSKNAAHTEGSSIYLQEGQKESVETLLYGLLLRSGNDAAVALAEHVGGSVQGFVKLMNEEAVEQGLAKSHFMNPTGLHDDAHLISAYDMAQMLNIAMQNTTFKKIAGSTFFSDGTHHFQNKHRLIGQNNAVAGKTGYTKVAGRTLATYFKYDDRAFTVVTINTPNDWQLHKELAQQVLERFERQQLVKKGTYHLGGKRILVDQPIDALVEKDSKVEHIVKYSRLYQDDARWYVVQKGEIIAARTVKIQ